jgi:hypothetical protein
MRGRTLVTATQKTDQKGQMPSTCRLQLEDENRGSSLAQLAAIASVKCLT